MPKYRRIPGEPIEARQWPYASGDVVEDHREWTGVAFNAHGCPFVTTIHGQAAYLAKGDWIIPEPDGIHYYPCKPDVFAKTYEPADTPEVITRQMTDAILHGQGMTITHIPFVDMIDAAPAVDTTDITEGALDPSVVSNGEPASSSGLPDDWFEEHDGQRLVLIPEKVRRHIAELDAKLQAKKIRLDAAVASNEALTDRIRELKAQLQAEGEHTAAANANIDRLNTEIERITRRQQGPLMGKE